MPITVTHWTWEDALYWYGTEQGPGEAKDLLRNELATQGYYLDAYDDEYGNENVVSLTAPNGTNLFAQTRRDDVENIREFLPPELVSHLDCQLPAHHCRATLETLDVTVAEDDLLTINVELTDEGVVIDVYTDTSNPPVVGTWRLYTELEN